MIDIAASLRRRFSRPKVIAGGQAAGLKLVAHGAHPDFAAGVYELPVQAAIADSLGAGDCFFDVGANIGFFSLVAARCVGDAGMVYAFEPVRANAARIARTAELNGLDGRLRVFEEAVGAATGRAELLLARHIGGAALSTADAPPDMAARAEVEIVTLDDAVVRHGLRPPRLVKIDVEGAEIDVLRGMTGVIRSHRPAIIYEVDDATREGLERKAEEIRSFLLDAGYGLELLPPAYDMTEWHVEHVLARPVS